MFGLSVILHPICLRHAMLSPLVMDTGGQPARQSEVVAGIHVEQVT